MMTKARLALAFSLALRAAVALRAAEWDPAKHPRVPKGDPEGGQFAPGGVGGVAGAPKVKAAPATKEQIGKAWELYQKKSSYAQIHAATGLNPKQAATIIHKIKKKEAAAKDAIAAKIEELDKFGSGDAAKAEKLVTEELAKGDAESAIAAKEISGAAGEAVGASAPDASLHSKTVAEKLSKAAQDEGYVWKAKVGGPNAGAYAWFKDNIQVSAFKKVPAHLSPPEQEWLKGEAAATMHFGQGPKKYVTPGVVASGAGAKDIQGLSVIGKDAGKGAWPISDDVDRRLSPKYESLMTAAGNKWENKLTFGERSHVKAYTGSAYSSINATLRKNPDFKPTSPSSSIAAIKSALAKADPAPPPDLVWRGIGGAHVATFVAGLGKGDVIRMDGFQSTSIKPSFAAAWGSGTTIFEIRPKIGAYVQGISSHKNEYEYLMPHGARYRVHGSAAVKLNGQKFNVVQLEHL